MAYWMSVTSLLLAGISPDAGTSMTSATRHVDLIELNHFVDEDGREVFKQVIFYDWSKNTPAISRPRMAINQE